MSNGAVITINIGTTAAAGETRSASLATEFTIETTHPSLPGTSQTSTVIQIATMDTAECATKDDIIFIDGIVTTTAHIQKQLPQRIDNQREREKDVWSAIFDSQ
jgi:hypothetical protein